MGTQEQKDRLHGVRLPSTTLNPAMSFKILNYKMRELMTISQT